MPLLQIIIITMTVAMGNFSREMVWIIFLIFRLPGIRAIVVHANNEKGMCVYIFCRQLFSGTVLLQDVNANIRPY